MVTDFATVRTIGSVSNASFLVISRQTVLVLMLKTRSVTACLTIMIKKNSCSSESDTESDESNTESIDDQPEESKNVATPQSTSTNTNTQEVSSVLGKA